MTKLGALNSFLFQWFFIRITRYEYRVKVIDEVDMTHASIIRDSRCSVGYRVIDWHWDITSWVGVQFGVLPLAGMDGRPWRYIGKSALHWRLTKKITRFEPSEPSEPPEHFNCRCTINPPSNGAKNDIGPAEGLAGQ